VHQGCVSEPFDALLLQAGAPELSTYFVAADAALEQRAAKSTSAQGNGFDKPVAFKSIISILRDLPNPADSRLSDLSSAADVSRICNWVLIKGDGTYGTIRR
jgi:hypothetical protein